MPRPILIARMGLRNVLRYRGRSFISAFAIFLSVLVMMALRGLVNGSETMVLEQLVRGQFGAVQIHKKGFGANVNRSPLTFAFPVSDALMQEIRAVAGVSAASARIPLAAMVNANDKTVVTPILAFDPDHEYAVCPFKAKDIARGDKVRGDFAVMTPQLQRQLGLELGGELTLVSQDAEGVMNAGLVKAGGFLADVPLLTTSKKLLFMPIAAAQSLLRIEGQAVEIAVGSDDFLHPEALRDRLRARLGPDYEIDTWRDRSALLLDSMNDRRAILNWVTGVFLVIALIGVTNAVLMSVLGRMREIGTMMAVGMKRRQIVFLFVTEATFLGLLGSATGAIAGWVLVRAVAVKGLPIVIPGQAQALLMRPSLELPYMLAVAGGVAVGCAIASIYPAFRAARLKPIQAMSAV